jgi:hypothetical protein
MAFNDRDAQVSQPRLVDESVERIEFVRDRNLPGVQLKIFVTGQAKAGGDVVRRITKTVPQSVIDTNWPGPQRTLKAWLLAIIDAAV